MDRPLSSRLDIQRDHDELAEDEGAADLQRIQAQLNELVGILGENVQKLLDRSENLENMENLAARLQEQANEFRVVTKRMRFKQMARSNKWLVLLVLLLVAMFIGVFCMVGILVNSRNP